MNRFQQPVIRRAAMATDLAALSSTSNTYGSSAYQSQKPLLLNKLGLEIPTLTTYDSSFISVYDAATIRIEVDNTNSAGEVYFSLAFSPTQAATSSFIAIDRNILAGEYYSQYFPTKSDFFSYSIANNNEYDISLNLYCSLSRFTQYETTSQLDNLVVGQDIATLTRQANDFQTDVALGQFQSYEIQDVNGYTTLDTSNNTSLVWESSQNYLELSSAETMNIFSLQDTVDTRQAIINVYGVNQLGQQIDETIFLDISNSTVPIQTIQTFLRVNKLDFVNGEKTNDAQIHCVSSGTSKLQELIPIGANVSKTVKYAVDSKHRGVLKSIFISGYVDSHDTTLTVYKHKYYPTRRREILRKIPIYTGATYSEEISRLIDKHEEVYCLVETKDQVDGLRNELNVTLMLNLVPI
jgi:hypothetical protein